MDLFSGEMNSDGRVLVVGAGPAGSLVATLLSRSGYDVVIAEEHQSVGFPVQCAGLISSNCFESYMKYCNVKRAVENVIKGAFFFSPSGKFLEVKGDAVVLDRKIFDLILAEKAAENSEFLIKRRIEEKDLTSSFFRIIGADGCYSTVAKTFGFERYEVFSALQVEMKFEAMDEKCVELYFGRRYSNGFFAYAIPINDVAKVGVISKDNPYLYLRQVVEKHPAVRGRVKGSMIEINAGCIPSRLVNFVNGNVALIGDAAGMVKPHTGGGLYYLLRAAEILSETFPNLDEYERWYRREFGREHLVGERIRKLYSLEDRDFDMLIDAFKDFDFSKLDMDKPSTVFNATTRLASKPRLALKILKVLLS